MGYRIRQTTAQEGYDKPQNRIERLELIKEIIRTEEISNQEELIERLNLHGINPGQATLSRDLKQLRVVKGVRKGGKSVYMLNENTNYRRVREHRATGIAIENGFMSIRISGQLAVIKCRPGYASGLASDIDTAEFPEIIGTIAGDDTIFLALEEDFDQDTLVADLRSIVPVYAGTHLNKK